MSGARYDVCVVGAGLVGLSVAHALVEAHPGIGVVVIDKEPVVAAHQSSHNSGVIHSGLYYAPGSLKARLCVDGRRRLLEWCRDWDVPHRVAGKLVVAVDASELARLDELERRGNMNGLVGLRRVRGAAEIQGIEPEATGIEGLSVPEAGVVDYPFLARRLADHLIGSGVDIRLGSAVSAIEEGPDGVAIRVPEGGVNAAVLVNCAGLQSDRVAAMAGAELSVQIVPFRGEYYRLSDAAAERVRSLVYPVPDPRFPFLGVHFTRRVDDVVEVGPNAVLALGREHYRGARWSPRDVAGMMGSAGLWKLALKNWRPGVRELRNSRSKRRYATLAQSLVPTIEPEDLEPGGSGVRAQAVSRDGRLVDDFVIEETASTVHVLNAPSPGATASPAIGRYVAARISSRFFG